MKYLFILFFLVLSFSTIAQVSRPQNLNPEFDKLLESSSEKPILTADPLELSRYKLDAGLLLGQSRFTQTGQGQEYDTKAGESFGISAGLLYSIEDKYLRLLGETNKMQFLEPESLGGSQVTVRRSWLSLAYGSKFLLMKSQAAFELGVGSTFQKADQFSNSSKLVPEYMSVGPLIAFHMVGEMSKSWSIKTSALVQTPLIFNDAGTDNGDHRSGYNATGSIFFVNRLKQNIFFKLGISALIEAHSFSGESNRGVTDSKYTLYALTIPAGVEYAF